ncbi:MAG: hypothetical protein FWE94_05625 [Coriobacteriia bacterium]|nr:hypothetical protein [Coriobacteriia bacterium]
MRKLALSFIVVCILLLGVGTAFAKPTNEAPIIDTEDANLSTVSPKIEYSLSEPVVSAGKGNTIYAVTLSVKGIEEFYGYQIEVVSGTQGAVTVASLVDGLETELVYKNGKQHLAVMTGVTPLSGDVEICDILVRYPYSDKNHSRKLEIDRLQVVTSVAAEKIETILSITLDLPYVDRPFYTQWWFYAAVIAVLMAGTGTALYIKKKKDAERGIEKGGKDIQGDSADAPTLHTPTPQTMVRPDVL